ncbi:MAG: universal stress protein [Pyrinomonadaceae bacterium]|nr:universal stress protein [Pyrinomonadaceae bacterium]MCX7640400.1 universal stress protein [Pyrinomonadaceae bacterium]MDW8304828.1 universal stress protein [Acidobacteriota bacterium]
MNKNFKVLIGYDGSSFADAAIDDLKNAGLPDNTEVIVLTIAEVWLPPHEEGEEIEFTTEELRQRFEKNLQILKEAERKAQQASERIRRNFPGWTVEAKATYGSPAWEILFLAESLKPDLIILGAQGVSGLKGILIGSVAQIVASEASCSVRIARGKVEVENSALRLLLGYDASKGAELAVEKICQRKWTDKTEVKLVAVKDEQIFSSLLRAENPNLENAVEEAVKKLKKCGLEASSVVCTGNPKKVLVEQAQQFAADCIFVGATSNEKTIKRYLLGSVASAIIARANCSVEIVR